MKLPSPIGEPASAGGSARFSVSLAERGPVRTEGARGFVEGAHITAAAGNPAGLFSPQLRYGSNRLWMLSIGIRLGAGAMHSRMGRYGAAVPPGSGMMMDMPGMHHSMTGPCTQ